MTNDIAYANRDFIPDADAFVPRWQTAAEEFRAAVERAGRPVREIRYGEGARQALDLFLPAGRPLGCAVFVHGGYWRAFDRTLWSHFAAGPLARGWAVAMPSYTLAPQVRITEIVKETAQAIRAAAAAVDGPLVLSGHSAGGHLVARMICAGEADAMGQEGRDAPLPPELLSRIRHVLPISPLSDLRPLIDTAMNDDLRLDPAEAAAQSPALLGKCAGIPVTVWVGAEERPAFLDQARWLRMAWPETMLRVDPGRHHFDVIDGLADPGSPLCDALLGGLQP